MKNHGMKLKIKGDKMKKSCNTVGELREALKNYPDDKPLIIDFDGNTYPVIVYDWSKDAISIDGNEERY